MSEREVGNEVVTVVATVDGQVIDAEWIEDSAHAKQRVAVGVVPVHTPATLAAVDGLAPVDQNPAAVYLSQLRGDGRRKMRESLDLVVSILSGVERVKDAWMGFPWERVRYQHVRAVRAELSGRHAPATANRILAAVRGVLKECWRLGKMSVEDFQRAVDFEPVRGGGDPAGRYVHADEIGALLRSCAEDESAHGVRDSAILAVLFGAGLRRAEVAALDLSNYDPQDESLRVLGKGNKRRTVYLPEDVTRRLDRWVEVRGDDTGPLFVPVHRSGRVRIRRLTQQAIYYALRKRVVAAEVERLTPHDARRTFASNLLDEGEDLNTVREMLGHSNVQTTAKYDRAAERRKRKAASKIRLG